ncbi:MAG TPA: SDR family NAD(P)-dependent oxidoreductase [Chryseolinea sp.]|nr:SDR family NAD(P)-dependent oxidoreductase [Chryseolinea sp.]
MEKQKFILVTGASSGLGKALTLELSSNGYTAFAGVRSENDKLLFSSQPNIIPVILDVSKSENISSAFQFISGITNQLGWYALINNAGINYLSAFELADERKERELFEVNLLGAMQLTRKMLPLLHQFVNSNTTTAKIINVSSIGGVFGLPWEASYHASKFAMIGFSQSLRYELEKLGISVCCFIPGGMKTNIFQKSIAASQAATQNNFHQHFPFYQKNLQHMHKVMHGFEKSSAPAHQAAKKVSRLLRNDRLPMKKYFGVDAIFIQIFTWLGLTSLLGGHFIAK